MYKIAIIDDDRIIRRGLSNIFSQENYGFQLVGTASDGERGLELIEEQRPQIVISDINMPFMNGLEMARIVKEKYPEIKVILLTGYEDFKYAQEAIKVRAFDYILKPIDSDALVAKVKLAADEWEKEQKKDKQIQEGMPLLHAQFFKKLIYNGIEPNRVKKEMTDLGIKLNGSKFAVLLIKVDDLQQLNGKNYKEAVQRICSNVFKNKIEGIVFEWDGDELAAVLPFSQQLIENNEGIHDIAEQIRFHVKNHLNTTVTIAVGNVYQSLTGIVLSYQSARTAMDLRHMIGKDTVFSIKNFTFPMQVNSMNLNELEEELVEKVTLGLSHEVLTVLEEMNNQLIDQKFIRLHEIRLMAIRIVVLLFHETEKWTKQFEESNLDLTSSYNKMMQMQTVEEIFNEISDIAVRLASYANTQRKSKEPTLVEKAMKYIEENYDQEGLSLQQVAREVHVSAAYLSNIFKVEKGINFGDFLLKTRMKKAMELLRDKNMKAYEVAEMVGYSNPQYFSVCFKKYTNYSPVDFKKLG
ncbi:response regulator [Bacillus taeanensis]|uniref:DNA-binding response regulator n=1 Tax=Bacillus taeanensis TaxID=273032 RepID=A0A366Y0N3_9BACI|nr:response regulator [Bacillus taeanensis]RBW69721.1 DNA-binding response regulator [Bacillus taeanensis]